MIILGSFIAGGVAGIAAYDGMYWGINTTLYKLSNSFNINLPNNTIIYMAIFAVALLVATFGCIVLGRKFTPPSAITS